MSDNTPPATPGDDASDVRPPLAKASEDKPQAPTQSSDDLLDLIRMQVSAVRKKAAEPDPEPVAPKPVAPLDAETPALVEVPETEAPKPEAPDPAAFFQKLRAAAREVEVPVPPAEADDDPLQLGKLAVAATPESPVEPEAVAPQAVVPVEAPAGKKRERAPQPGPDRTGSDRRRRTRGGRDRRRRSGTGEDSSRQPPERESERIQAPAPEIAEGDTTLTGAYYEQVVERPKRAFVQVEPGDPLDLPETDPKLAAKFEKILANMGQAVVVRYSEMRETGVFEHSLEVPPAPGTTVVIRSERGVELGKVLVRVAEANVPPPVETAELTEWSEGDATPAGVDETPVETQAEATQGTPGLLTEAFAEASTEVQSGCGGGCGGCGDDAKPYGWIERDQLIHFLATNGEAFPFNTSGRVLRVANTHDMSDDKAMRDRVPDQLKYCREQIRELKLRMRLVSVENLLGGERMVFCFTSEDRVDFRDLVKRLTAKFKTRVELRQVGARDEARIKADYERCGQRCCCQAYIKNLQPVSMRMAKLQKATLDPSKISGRCSRLMCCLRYEDACYTELKKGLPHKNTWVRTASMLGRVVSTHILSQMVKVRLADGTPETFAIEEIIERNCDAPNPQEASAGRRPRRDAPRDFSQRTFLRDDETRAAPAESRAEPLPEAPAGNASAPASQSATPPAKGESGEAPRKRRRRGGRRRRKPRGDGANSNGSNNGGSSTPSAGGAAS